MTESSAAEVRAVITGTGSYLPESVLTNDDLSKRVDTSDEWIFPRTGIRRRHIAAPGETTSDMGAKAAAVALERAGVRPEEIDLLILATITADSPLPAASCLVQKRLGLVNATCFDLGAACSGFVYALDVARSFALAGTARKILVVGAEKMSAVTDWTDRGTCILFGDGAGAVVVERREGGASGILSVATGSDGSLADLLYIKAGGSALPASAETVAAREHFIRMDGHAIFKFAVRNMVAVSQEALARAGLTAADVDWVVPHQANRRIIEAAAKNLGIPFEKTVNTIEDTGNTTAGTIPIALHAGITDGRIKKGDILLFATFGAGLTWGASVVRM